MLKKEWLMASLLALATLTAALLLLRWLAPNLIGAPIDLRLVQTAQEVPPFYRNVFRNEDVDSDQFILNDPETVARAKPLYPDLDAMGRNDILGFRNRDVPNVADIVTIGDSQTYGNNAPLEQDWPSQLETLLGAERQLRVYNMSVGAWGALSYLAVLEYALRLQPRIVIVAFYTGNDPLTDFTGAYGNPAWERFRVDSTLTAADAPSVVFPPPLSGVYGISGRHGGVARAYVITRRGKWILPNADMALANGWGEGGTVKLAPIAWRDLITVPTLGVVDEVDPSRFGPAAEREP